MDELKEMMVNRMTSTPEPNMKSMEEPLVEERKFQFCECCLYDDDSTITIDLNPQNDSISSPVEPEDSLTMGDEPLDTILATESDEFNESSVENLVPIQSESGENSNGDSSFHPSFTPVEGSDAVLHEIEAFLANDSIPIMDDDNFDPEEDIRLLEELLNEELSTSLPPMSNEDLVEAESYTDSHNEYTSSDEDSCGDIDDDDEDDDDLVPRVSEAFNKTITNPLFDFESDFNQISNNPIFDIPSDESEMEPEVQDSHHMLDSFHEKFSGELSHIISPPENDPFCFEEDPDPGGDVLNHENLIIGDLTPTLPPVVFVEKCVDDKSALDDEEWIFILIKIFLPFFTFDVISLILHSTGSEDTVFYPASLLPSGRSICSPQERINSGIESSSCDSVNKNKRFVGGTPCLSFHLLIFLISNN